MFTQLTSLLHVHYRRSSLSAAGIHRTQRFLQIFSASSYVMSTYSNSRATRYSAATTPSHALTSSASSVMARRRAERLERDRERSAHIPTHTGESRAVLGLSSSNHTSAPATVQPSHAASDRSNKQVLLSFHSSTMFRTVFQWIWLVWFRSGPTKVYLVDGSSSKLTN